MWIIERGVNVGYSTLGAVSFQRLLLILGFGWINDLGCLMESLYWRGNCKYDNFGGLSHKS